MQQRRSLEEEQERFLNTGGGDQVLKCEKVCNLFLVYIFAHFCNF